jgi:hypothetical protein
MITSSVTSQVFRLKAKGYRKKQCVITFNYSGTRAEGFEWTDQGVKRYLIYFSLQAKNLE